MGSQRLTSKEVAKQAGVSQSTVSFVLNNVDSANISQETKQRVWDTAQRLGYVPNVAARALARGRSNTIALVLDHPHPQVFIDEYIPKIMTGLNQVMRENDYRILVEIVDDTNYMETYLNLIRGKEVAGIVLSHDRLETSLDQLVSYSEQGFPVVTLNEHPQLNCIMVDKLDGVRQAVQHLIALGHKRIACITYGPALKGTHVYKRLLVYRQVLKEAGIPYDESLVRIGGYDPETGFDAMRSILDVPNRPTALFAMNDVMAFGAITAIYNAGLRIPADIAVVGFDDIRLARYAQPALTTIFEPDVEHGRLAGESLLQLINSEQIPKVQVLPTRLVIRDSCGFHRRSEQQQR